VRGSLVSEGVHYLGNNSGNGELYRV